LNALTWTLSATAAAVGALHTLAPDHWIPFAALARTRHWSALRTARTTVLCGFGHVTVSAALGVAALFAGLGAIRMLGGTLAGLASFLLIAFGAIYMIWGLHRSFRRDPHGVLHPHDHHHAHGHHDHDHGLTEWSLFALFAADPCVAVVPMILAAAGAGWFAVAAVIAAYEVATIATMVVLVTAAHAGIRGLRAPFLDRFGDAIAGGIIVLVGTAVTLMGI